MTQKHLTESSCENILNPKEIHAKAGATILVNFDHVAMDNFHAVFGRMS